MSSARIRASRENPGHVDLNNLSPMEYALVKDGLAALLAALPWQHSLRPEVAELIEALKENS